MPTPPARDRRDGGCALRTRIARSARRIFAATAAALETAATRRQTSSFAAGGQLRRGAAGGPATQLVCGRDGTALVFEPVQGVGLVGTLSQPVPACGAASRHCAGLDPARRTVAGATSSAVPA